MNPVFLIQPMATVIVIVIWLCVTWPVVDMCPTRLAKSIALIVATSVLTLVIIDIWRNGF